MKAFLVLLQKELRALAPMVVLGFAIISGDIFSRPLTERLDENTWTHVAGIEPGSGGSFATFLAILAFIVAYAALPREHDERTIELLYSLPVRRSQIFFAKVLAGLTVLSVVAVLGQVTNYALIVLNPSSFEGSQFRLGIATGIAFQHAVFSCIAYAHGLLASTLRRFGALPYVALAFTISFATQLVPGLSWLSPVFIVEPVYIGQELVIAWPTIGLHAAIAVAVLLVSYQVWMGPLDGVRDAVVQRSLGATLLFAVGSLGVLVLGCVLSITYVALRPEAAQEVIDEAESQRAPVEPTHGTVEAETRHYRAVYPSFAEVPATQLLSMADRVYEATSRVVGEELPAPISLDLSDTSPGHEGITSGSRIRMALAPTWGRSLHVLAHETAHSLQHHAGGELYPSRGAEVRAFIEGSAEWAAFVALEAIDDPRLGEVHAEERLLRRSARRVAVLAFDRLELRFDDLLAGGELTRRYDTSLVYTLGETIAEAVERACGAGSIARVLRAVGRPEGAADLTGPERMRDALVTMRCDYEAVATAHDVLMAELRAADTVFFASVPRLVLDRVESVDGNVVVVARLEGTPLESDSYALLVRAHAGVADSELRAVPGERTGAEVRFEPSAEWATGARTIDVMLTQSIDARAFPLAGRWMTVELAR